MTDEWGLRLIDVSQPYTPTVRGYIGLQGEVANATSGVAVSDTLAYVAQDVVGLRIVDVSNPAFPTLIGTYREELGMQGAFDVAVAGTRAYVTGAGSFLKIIDVSDPLHPVLLGDYYDSYMTERVTVVDGTAFVAAGSGGVLAIDGSDPSSPVLAGSFDTWGYATAIAVAGSHLYVADRHGGLLVLAIGTGEPHANSMVWNGPVSTPPAHVAGPRGRLPPHSHPGAALLSPGGAGGIREEGQASPIRLPGARLGLDSRRVSTACLVTTSADGGPGTLRECMENATSGDTVTFDATAFPPTSPATITLQTELPHIYCGDLTIDASNAGVVLDGSQMEGGVGLSVDSGGNTIRGLQVVRFAHTGINLPDRSSSYNIIGGDRTIGSGPLGQGNLISGNGMGGGVFIGGSNNVVAGNFIGTDVSGERAFQGREGYFDHGIFMAGASNNRIGGTSSGERNIISANGGYGIAMQFGSVNVIVGNYIGTDVSGTADLGNVGTGVSIELGSAHNTVKGNLISGSNWGGVSLADVGTDYNVVVGNLIGTDASGTRALGNRWCGVATGERFNRIGGTSSGEGNVISGNPQGISLQGEHNLVLGNFIGTDISGVEAIGNEQGVFMAGTSRLNFVGGTTPAERNVISGNVFEGVVLGGVGPTLILGNYVGTDVGGRMPVPNRRTGIAIEGARQAVIQSNLVSSNEGGGVSVSAGEARLRANRIGVAADGVSPLPNDSSGVAIWAASNEVGGAHVEDGNVIAFNHGDGVQVWTYAGNTIRRTSIYGNSGAGIHLGDGANNQLAAPVITHAVFGIVSGTACPGCIVELFSDDEDEGRVYEGTTIADDSGNWKWAGSLAGPYVTATATDEAGNTSAFSAPHVAWQHWLSVPLILMGAK